MEKINLFLMDMSDDQLTSGVDRYLSVLTEGLKKYAFLSVCRIRLVRSASVRFPREKTTDFGTEVVLPLPQQMTEIIREAYWIDKYNEIVFHRIRRLFDGKRRIVLHLHTLNLIDLALVVKKHYPCRILTHLHCIPWKNLYNTSLPRFNRLYEQVYIRPEPGVEARLCLSDGEKRAYELSDEVICVTRCAQEFVKKVSSKNPAAVHLIPNGMDDRTPAAVVPADGLPPKQGVELLYAGLICESKGVFFLLDALRAIRKRGYDVSLHLVGKAYSRELQRIRTGYSDLPVGLPGCVPFEKLCAYYRRCDIGVLPSLQEQASYVAIEMAMFGMPLVVTAVDGLDETFTHGRDARKITPCFSRTRGLHMDVQQLAETLIALIGQPGERVALGERARQLYERELTLDRMAERTVRVYVELANREI